MSPTKAKNAPLELDAKAVTEFFKPARLEIYESLQTAGPASISELAERLGRAPDSLYYHVRKLVGIGVLEQRVDQEAGSGSPGRNGAVYGTTADSVTMQLNPKSPRSREAWGRGAASVLRLISRDVDAAVESPTTRTTGPQRNLLVQRSKARLGPADLKRVNALIDELYAVLADSAENTKGQFYALNCALTPLKESSR